jgi:hypothetical protein
MVLASYNDTNDVTFGMTLSGRQAPVPGLERIAASAIGRVPVRVRLDSKKPVSTFLQELQEEASEMIPHEQYGLYNIRDLSEDARQAVAGSTWLVIQPGQKAATSTKSTAEPLLSPVGPEILKAEDGMLRSCRYSLILHGFVHEDHIELFFVYRSNIISVPQLDAVTSQMQSVVEQLTAQDKKLLGAVSVPDPDEAQ